MRKSKCFFELLVIGSALLIVGFAGCGQQMTSEVTPSEEALEETAIETTSQKTEPASVTVVSATPMQSALTSSTPSSNASLPQDRAERNKQIQLALQHAGFYGGGIDGKVGPLTQKAVEDFQRSKGLKVDGKVGPMTWGELEKYLSEGTQQ